MKTALLFLLLSIPACAQVGSGCTTNTGAATGSVQSYGFCQPNVIDGRNKGGWIALNRAGDLSNNELECYEPQAVGISQGLLTIQATAKTKTCGYFPAQTGTATFNGTFTSGFVQMNTFNFTGGDILVRAKGPSNVASGGWPAIWLLGSNCELSSKVTADNTTFNGKTCAWHTTGSEEIDIWEELNGTSLTSSTCNYFLNTNIRNSSSYTYTDSSVNWHIYELRWVSGTSLQWWIDGVQITGCNASPADVPSSPMFLQMNIAMGPGATGTGLSSSMQIDWVKICSTTCTNNGANVIFFDDFIIPPVQTQLHPASRLARMASAAQPAATGTPPLGLIAKEIQ